MVTATQWQSMIFIWDDERWHS